MFLGKFVRKFKFDLLQKLPSRTAMQCYASAKNSPCLLLLRALPRNDFFNIEEI